MSVRGKSEKNEIIHGSPKPVIARMIEPGNSDQFHLNGAHGALRNEQMR